MKKKKEFSSKFPCTIIDHWHANYSLFYNDCQLKTAKAANKVSWCPLFGALPYAKQPWLEQVSACMDIIEFARKMWKSGDSAEYFKASKQQGSLIFPGENVVRRTKYDFGEFLKCPKPDTIPLYPKKKLLVARRIFNKYESQFSVLVDMKLRRPYNGPAGVDYLDKLYQVEGEKLRAFLCKRMGEEEDIIEVPELFSLLAIIKAWDVLKKILCEGESGNNPEIKRNVQYAQKLFKNAYDYKVEKDTEHGLKFKGSNKGKIDDLQRELARVFKLLHKKNKKTPQAKELWNKLTEYGNEEIIQEIDHDDNIVWRTKRGLLRKPTSFNTFLNRYTKIKKQN